MPLWPTPMDGFKALRTLSVRADRYFVLNENLVFVQILIFDCWYCMSFDYLTLGLNFSHMHVELLFLSTKSWSIFLKMSNCLLR